jgi:hypothetical protein
MKSDKRNSLDTMLRTLRLALLLLVPCGFATAQTQTDPKPIQDNSFLVEEAYNQEKGIVQHINTFLYFAESHDWFYTFTQEWPVPGDARHQLSYTLMVVSPGGSSSGVGFGDALLNYRYQLVGNGGTRVAFAPRVSLILPTGDSRQGRGFGGTGVQTSLPLSVVVNRKLVTHWNAGATFIPNAQDVVGNHASTAGYNFGQSFIWLARPRVNFMLETVFASAQAVVARDKTTWENALLVSPGVRWAYNFKNGLQIVPGVAMPLGVGPSAGEKGFLLYLSFEHPFERLDK